LGTPFLLGSAYVFWNGTSGGDDKSFVGVAPDGGTPWTSITANNVPVGHGLAEFTSGPREEWVSTAYSGYDDIWDGNQAAPPSGVWGTGNNWVDNSAPGPSDTATFNVPQTYAVTFAAHPPAIQNLTVSAGTVTFQNSGGVKTLNVNSGGEMDAVVSAATLNLGTTANTLPINLTVGDDLILDSGGILNINAGSVATVSAGGELSIKSGGTINISDGCLLVTTTGSIGVGSDVIGTVNVTGDGAEWDNSGNLNVGGDGQGSLNITGGGDVVNQGSSYLGKNAGAVGIAAVSGTAPLGSMLYTGGTLYVGAEGNGSLQVAGNGVLISVTDAYIGDGALSTGEVTVEDMGIMSVTNGTLYVANSSQDGTLTINDGGLVSSPAGKVGAMNGSIGVVTIDDATWTMAGGLDIGDGGKGMVMVSGGGQLITGAAVAFGAVHIGVQDLADIVSTVTVDGTGSNWANATQDLYVGLHGKATLTITNGGQVVNKFAAIGFNTTAAGAVTVDGESSMWINNGLLSVGDQGYGEMHITSGGMVRSTFGRVANNHDAQVTVDGMESTWDIVEDLKLGVLKAAIMTISNGGRVNSMAGILGLDAGSMGTVTVDGMDENANPSSWVVVNDLDIQRGSLTVNNGGIVMADNITVGPAGKLHGNGNIVGNVGNNGLVSPGTSTGALHVDGDYVQSVDAKLKVELASGASFDQLLITGSADLAGTLDIALLDGLAISGERFLPILTAANVMDQFDMELLPSVPDVTFDVIYNPTSVVLHIVAPTLPGDFDMDRDVDGRDFLIWQRGGSPSPLSTGDFADWQANYGASGSPASEVGTPEPTTAIILLIAMMSMLRMSRGCIASRAFR
jgi:T5SS/PEP-CTERM-associated repeat protein